MCLVCIYLCQDIIVICVFIHMHADQILYMNSLYSQANNIFMITKFHLSSQVLKHPCG